MVFTVLHVPKYFLVMPEVLPRVAVRLLSITAHLASLLWACRLGFRYSCALVLPTAFSETAEAGLRTPGRKGTERTVPRDSLESFLQMAEI